MYGRCTAHLNLGDTPFRYPPAGSCSFATAGRIDEAAALAASSAPVQGTAIGRSWNAMGRDTSAHLINYETHALA